MNTILSISMSIMLLSSALLIFQQVQATGGAGQIKDLIDPMLERAIEYLQQGNIELALEEIETVKKELSDTYEADKD